MSFTIPQIPTTGFVPYPLDFIEYGSTAFGSRKTLASGFCQIQPNAASLAAVPDAGANSSSAVFFLTGGSVGEGDGGAGLYYYSSTSTATPSAIVAGIAPLVIMPASTVGRWLWVPVQTAGIASNANLGLIKVGSGLGITSDGHLYVIGTAPVIPPTPVSTPNGNWGSIATDGTNLLAVSDSTNFLMKSIDGGFTWTLETPVATGHTNFVAVAWGGGVWCVMTTDGYCQTSPDGVTWTAQTTPFQGAGSIVITAMAYGAGAFVVTGRGSALASAHSIDGGVTWINDTSSSNPLPTSLQWCQIAYGAGKFVAVQPTGYDATAYYSADGINWTASAETDLYSVVTYGNGFFYAGGGNLSGPQLGFLRKSADGITWTSTASSIPTGVAVQSVSASAAGLALSTYSGLFTGDIVIFVSTDGGTTWANQSFAFEPNGGEGGMPGIALGSNFIVVCQGTTALVFGAELVTPPGVPGGAFTLASGAATVPNPAINTNSTIAFAISTLSGTATYINFVLTPGVGFTVIGNPGDNSTYNYTIQEVA